MRTCHARVARVGEPVPCTLPMSLSGMVHGTCSSHDDLYQIGVTYTFRYRVILVQVLKWHLFRRLKHVCSILLQRGFCEVVHVDGDN